VSTDTASTRSTWHTTMPGALGELTLVRDGDGLRGLYFDHHWYMPGKTTFGPESDCGFTDVITQLNQYLGGTRQDFVLTLAPRGDEFQLRVWGLLAQIGYGQTAADGDLAVRLGGEVTAQQVGAAIGRNP